MGKRCRWQLQLLLSGCAHAFLLVALQLGSTAIGVLTNEGVVLAVEKRVTSPLLVSAVSALAIWHLCSQPSDAQTIMSFVG